MTLAITSNPFIQKPAINPINKVEGKKPEFTANNVASNPVKPLSAEAADAQVKKYSDCMASYGMAMVAMKGSGATSNSGQGMVGTETSGTVG